VVGGGTWSNLARVLGQTQLPDHADLCSSRETFVNDLSDYESSAPAATIAPSCGEEQLQFETQQCKWLEAKMSTCIGFDECLEEVGLATLKSEIEANIVNRKAMFLSIQKLKCRLGHLHDAFSAAGGPSSFNTPDTCGTTVDPEPAKFALTLDVPTYQKCSSDIDITNPVQPSTDVTNRCTDWLKQEFNSHSDTSHTYDLETHTAIAICKTSCNLPTLIGGPPNVVIGCIDLHDTDTLCPFYDKHFDACPHYDENGFSASSTCCACGGGTNPTTTTTTVMGCVAADCSGNGVTTDADRTDGCTCVCDPLYTASDCSELVTCANGVFGNYVVIDSHNSQQQLNIMEVLVNGQSPAVGLLSNTLDPKYPASKCIDGDATTFCHTESMGNWKAQFGLSVPTCVTSIRIHNRWCNGGGCSVISSRIMGAVVSVASLRQDSSDPWATDSWVSPPIASDSEWYSFSPQTINQ